jgi:hypothetical protein
MATAQTIINRAMRLIGALEAGETPTADETTDVLYALNSMLESWRLERLMVYAITDTTKTLTPNDAVYTVGPSQDIDVVRPIKVDSAYVTDNGIDVPITIADKQAWDRIADKDTTTTYPTILYYEPTYPNALIKLWPVPTVANVLTLKLWGVLGGFATAATSVSLPPGYERALAYNLAVEIAPEFQLPVPEAVVGLALNSKASIKRVNSPLIVSQIESASMNGGRYNVFTDA